MKHLKKLWIGLIAMLPSAAVALPTFVWGLLIGGAGIGLYSTYRSIAPVDTADALSFFGGCWSCQMFVDVMEIMSNLLSAIYKSLGGIMIPFMAALTLIWFAWSMIKGYTEGKIESAWNVTERFGTHFIKFGFVAALLLMPLPRMISDIILEPVFSIGQSVVHHVTDESDFNSCLIATSLMDPSLAAGINHGAFSPRLRHGLACELVTIHQMTGVGMTVGWTMMNMAFNIDYMHTILFDIPVLPNIPMFFAGLLVLVLYFMALLPIPIYFLEIFIKLTMDLVMLPIMLLSWLFKDWKIINKTKTLREVVDDVITGVVGITMTCIFLVFSIEFLNIILGGSTSFESLAEILASDSGDTASHLMDALVLRNDSLITLVLMGIFMAMFMTSIPQLIKTFFKVNISDDFYNSTKKNLNTMWNNGKKIFNKGKN
ncbi:MAG: hypothetical protein J6R22_05525 [Alphaproteobacteria bacterium]|nr:hypothetical protein [Alphaproteobacteria bacterium]